MVASPARTLASASVSSAEQRLVGGGHRLAHEGEQAHDLLVDARPARGGSRPGAAAAARLRQLCADLFGGPGLEALVVDLAVRGAADRVDRQHALGRLVRGELPLHVRDDRRARRARAPGCQLDDRGDGLAELLVGHADRDGVDDGLVGLEDLLDLLGVHLLAAGVDAHRAAPEEGERAVGLDRGVVAGHGVPLALERRGTSPPSSPGPCSSRPAGSPPTATRPVSPEPGSTTRPSSVITLRVLAELELRRGARAARRSTRTGPCRAPRRTRTRRRSSSRGGGASRPCFDSSLNITPDDDTMNRLEMSYLPGAASRARSIGLAKASPTIAMVLTPSRSIVASSSSMSRLRASSVTEQPPPDRMISWVKQPGAVHERAGRQARRARPR